MNTTHHSSRKASCCPSKQPARKPFDFILWGSLSVIIITLAGGFFFPQIPEFQIYAYAIIDFLKRMWWGIMIGTFFVGLMGQVPRAYFHKLLGRGDTIQGVVRAMFAGITLDLCSHGILLIGAKLYERGASLAQVMAFLIASPWNSISLTLVLIGLIGLKLTLVYILGSAIIALLTGWLYLLLTQRGVFPENPHNVEDAGDNVEIVKDLKTFLSSGNINIPFFKKVILNGLSDLGMLLRWLLLGVVIAAAIKAFISPEVFTQWFGPSLIGLGMTLIAATIIEVCSEGSAPIASEVVNSAGAPGNGFAFLMAGVATDYTEITVIKEFTKKWSIALSLPLLTIPQILILGWLLNAL